MDAPFKTIGEVNAYEENEVVKIQARGLPEATKKKRIREVEKECEAHRKTLLANAKGGGGGGGRRGGGPQPMLMSLPAPSGGNASGGGGSGVPPAAPLFDAVDASTSNPDPKVSKTSITQQLLRGNGCRQFSELCTKPVHKFESEEAARRANARFRTDTCLVTLKPARYPWIVESLHCYLTGSLPSISSLLPHAIPPFKHLLPHAIPPFKHFLCTSEWGPAASRARARLF